MKKIPVGLLKTNCYLVIREETNELIVIDPGDEFERLLKEIGSYQVKEILLTHSHFDHVGALQAMENHFHLKHNEVKSNFVYEVIPTPGHTKDSLCFYFPEIHAVFVGDFIFEESIGRTDLGGNEEDMKKSIEMFLNYFSSNVILYPGHGNQTTLDQERSFLTFIKDRL